MSTLVKNPNVPQDQMLLQLQNGGGGNVITSPVKASLVNGDRQSEDEEEEDTEEEVEVEEEEEVSAYETGEDTENDTGTETGLVTRNPIFLWLAFIEKNTVLDPSTVLNLLVISNDYR